MSYWLRCKDAHQLLSEKIDRPLARGEKLALSLHLAMCRSCQNFSGQMDLLHQAMRRWPEQKQSENPQKSTDKPES